MCVEMVMIALPIAAEDALCVALASKSHISAELTPTSSRPASFAAYSIEMPVAARPISIQGYRGASKGRSEEHTSELQSLMRISYAVFCLKKNKKKIRSTYAITRIQQTRQNTRVCKRSNKYTETNNHS